MKNFKKTVALLVMYVMTVLMLPIGNFKAYATENVPQYLTINDMYVESISQYKNKALVTYEKDGSSILSLFTNGTEKVIKEFKNSNEYNQYVSIIDGNGKAYVIETQNNFESAKSTYYSFDFDNETLTETNENDVVYPSNNNYPNYKYDRIEDETTKNLIIEKINSKFNTNHTLNNTQVYINKIVVDNGKPMYEYSAYAYYDNISEEYFGLYSDSFDLLFGGYHSYNAYMNSTTGSYLIQENPYTNNSKLYIIKNAEIVSECKVDSKFSLYNSYYSNDKLITREYEENTYNEYSIVNGELIKTLSIPMANNVFVPRDKDNNLWTYFTENGKAYIAKVENGKAIKKYEVPDFTGSNYYSGIIINIYDENNIVLTNSNKTVFIQNEPVVTPEEPSDDNTTTPDDNNNSNDSNNGTTDNDNNSNNGNNEATDNDNNKPNDDNTVVVTPDENGTSKVAIAEIKADSVNNITLNKDTTKFEISITDIEALKNSTGSIQVTASNNIDINLPFSTIDKVILEGAKAVKLQYSTVENSDITKDIKGLKKVFNFELIVEKESGNVSIHNFANGVAEVKITLTNEELNGLNKDNLAVFYYNETTKKFEMMETRIEGNNVIFKTPHFSSFVIAEKNTVNGNTIAQTLPQTGAPISSSLVVVFALVLVGSGIVLANKRKFIR